MVFFRMIFVAGFLVVSTFGNTSNVNQNSEFKKWIGKLYKDRSELNPSLVEGSSVLIGPDGEVKYYITICGMKPWTPDKGDPEIAYVFFDSITGYSGKTPVLRVLDVIEIHLKDAPAQSEIRIGECSLQDKLDAASVGIYSTIKAAATKNGIQPQKIWKADLTTFKFIEIPATKYLCMPQNVGDDAGE